jgi:hypothetical protein
MIYLKLSIIHAVIALAASIGFMGHNGGPIGYLHGWCETMIIRADMAINPGNWVTGQSEDTDN